MPLKKNRSLKAIDFFCGGGGMTCGLRQAGIDVIAGIDFDKECEETYESNNKGSVFVHSDITTLNVDFLEKKFNVKKNDNELIFVGCSPCQYYSIINTSKEKAKKSKDLLLDFKRFVDPEKPLYGFQQRIADKTVADDHVGYLPREEVRTFDVADEVELFGFFHQFIGRLALGVAFGFLLSDIQYRDPGIPDPEHSLGVNRTDNAVLSQYFGLAIDVQTYVEQQDFPARDGRSDRGDRGTYHAYDRHRRP